jgi:quinol monooxygenase YgiN
MNEIKSNISQIAELRANPGQADPLREALLELEIFTRQESGCTRFLFFQAISEPDAFLLVEEFSSEKALRTHLDASYTKNFFSLGLVADVTVRKL